MDSASARISVSLGSPVLSKYDWQVSTPASSSAVSMVESSTFEYRAPVLMSRK